MEVGEGCVVQVTTQQKNPDGSYSIAEALTFVPNVFIKEVLYDDVIKYRYLHPFYEVFSEQYFSWADRVKILFTGSC